MLMQDLAHEVIQELKPLKADRANLDSHWQEIAERVLPAHWKLFLSQSTPGTRGEKRNEHIFDSTAPVALKRFGSILESLLTPRNQTWHKLIPSDPYLIKDRQSRLWFEEATRLLFTFRYAAQANFSAQNQLDFISLGAYGTSTMFIDQLQRSPRNAKGGIRYKNAFIGQIYIKENHQGIVDTVYREFPMTMDQILKRWGNIVPESFKSLAAKNSVRQINVIHRVQPRTTDYDPTRLDHLGMLYSSVYVLTEPKMVLEEGGYNTWPYPTARYEQAPDEAYGRSPAMDVLPALKTLNEQKKTVLKQGHRVVDPVLLLHDDGILNSFSMKPGALNPGGVSKEGRALVQALPVGSIAIGKDLMDDERQVINDAFLVNLFQILTENPQMTATEVIERTKEKGMLFAPTTGRLQTEKLGPTIERELDVLAMQNLLPPMPGLLKEAQGEFTIQYDSPITRAQRAEEASGIMRSIETSLQVVNVTQNPEPLDHFNWDVIIPELSDIQGVPAKWMRSKEEIQKIREGRVQAQQDQQDLQAAPGTAALLKATAAVRKGQ